MNTTSSGDAFYTQLGKALDAWASLELVLSWWLGYLTGMPPGMTRAIFYSANGFAPKRDMLRRALNEAKTSWRPPYNPLGGSDYHLRAADPELVVFLDEALKKVGNYSGARNSVAHRLTMLDKDKNEYSLVDRGEWWSDAGLSIHHLEEMVERMTSLLKILRSVLVHVTSPAKSLPKMSVSEGLLQIRQLPGDAHSPTTAKS